MEALEIRRNSRRSRMRNLSLLSKPVTRERPVKATATRKMWPLLHGAFTGRLAHLEVQTAEPLGCRTTQRVCKGSSKRLSCCTAEQVRVVPRTVSCTATSVCRRISYCLRGDGSE